METDKPIRVGGRDEGVPWRQTRPWVNQGYEEGETMRKQDIY